MVVVADQELPVNMSSMNEYISFLEECVEFRFVSQILIIISVSDLSAFEIGKINKFLGLSTR